MAGLYFRKEVSITLSSRCQEGDIANILSLLELAKEGITVNVPSLIEVPKECESKEKKPLFYSPGMCLVALLWKSGQHQILLGCFVCDPNAFRWHVCHLLCFVVNQKGSKLDFSTNHFSFSSLAEEKKSQAIGFWNVTTALALLSLGGSEIERQVEDRGVLRAQVVCWFKTTELWKRFSLTAAFYSTSAVTAWLFCQCILEILFLFSLKSQAQTI